MNKKVFLLGCLVVFLISLFLSVKTYSRYHTSVSVGGTIYSASWHFEVNNQTSNFNTNLGELYPGVNRSFDIDISSIGSDVPITYTITFNNPVNVPANLKFYSDILKHNQINLSGGTIIGEIAANTTDKVTIYYDWFNDSVDNVIPGNASFNMSIVGVQQDPTA